MIVVIISSKTCSSIHIFQCKNVLKVPSRGFYNMDKQKFYATRKETFPLIKLAVTLNGGCQELGKKVGISERKISDMLYLGSREKGYTYLEAEIIDGVIDTCLDAYSKLFKSEINNDDLPAIDEKIPVNPQIVSLSKDYFRAVKERKIKLPKEV